MIAQGYVWYLQAFYDKEEETIIRSRDEIKELYDQCEDGKIKGYLFWLYMNLSEELMKDAKLRMELIKELYQEGCQNPLLQFEGCCILGEDEQLLDEIDSYELWVLEFGAEGEDPEFQTHWKDLFFDFKKQGIFRRSPLVVPLYL